MKKLFNIALVAFALILNTNVSIAHDCPSNTYAESVSNLDPDIEPTGYTYSQISNGNGTWDVTAPYGHVTGIATCNTTSGSWGTAYPQYNFEQGTEGQYCWCKMLSPARSAWGSNYAYSSASDCAADCAYNCSSSVRYYADYRGGVFGSAYSCVANYTDDCTTGTHFLDPATTPTDDSFSETDKTWAVITSYGNVTGIATCNSTTGSWTVAYPQYDFAQGTTGQHCWCKMTSPTNSAWVYRYDHGSATTCTAYCANNCSAHVRSIAAFRGAVFGSADDHCIANTININWKNATGDTHASNTCTYGGELSTPATAPTKRGYIFTGWAFE